MTKLIKSSSVEKTHRSHVILSIMSHQSNFKIKLMFDSEPVQVPQDQPNMWRPQEEQECFGPDL